jgi:hypothetical protein
VTEISEIVYFTILLLFLFFFTEDDEIPPQYDSEVVKSSVTITSAFQSDPMSTSFYGSLPESIPSENAKSVPIPITSSSSSTVTRTYVEYTSSPEVAGSIDTQKKTITKYLDEADLDFEKTFQQQSGLTTITTVTTTVSSDGKESTSTTTEKVETSSSKDEKLWDKPLGIYYNHTIYSNSNLCNQSHCVFLVLKKNPKTHKSHS